MPEFEVPPVPPDRIVRGEEWRALWVLAHMEMAPWGRRPAPYLIDALLDPLKRERRWVRHRLGSVARVTIEREHDQEQPDGALRWYETMTDPQGRKCRVRIVVNPRLNLVYSVFPE